MFGKKRTKAEVQANLKKWEGTKRVLEAEDLRLKNELPREDLSDKEKSQIKKQLLNSLAKLKACNDKIKQLKKEEEKAA